MEIAQWAEATSPQEAAQRFDISTRTVTRYAAEARMAYYLENDLPPEANWGELQVTLARRYAEVAREALELGAAYLKGKEVGNAQRALITAGIATDKAQLLSGNATARKEVSVELQVDSLLSALARIESRVALPRPLDSSIIDVPDKR
ncbi:MAG: hypothetical protein ACRD6B_03950 [Bryobacteraceae bacterium]